MFVRVSTTGRRQLVQLSGLRLLITSQLTHFLLDILSLCTVQFRQHFNRLQRHPRRLGGVLRLAVSGAIQVEAKELVGSRRLERHHRHVLSSLGPLRIEAGLDRVVERNRVDHVRETILLVINLFLIYLFIFVDLLFIQHIIFALLHFRIGAPLLAHRREERGACYHHQTATSRAAPSPDGIHW